MPATSLSSLIIELVDSMESSVTSLREHHRSQQAVRRLVREAQSHELDTGVGAAVGVGITAPGAPLLAGTPLRQKRPEQAGDDECGVAVDHPVADCACTVR